MSACPCTPRALLVPQALPYLAPAQRVSSAELMRRDREWKRRAAGPSKQDGTASKAGEVQGLKSR